MANVSIREAVKIYQVSRPTLTKALKTGKISGVQDGKGQWQIDPSELSRVYQPRAGQPENIDQGISVNFTSANTTLQDEVDALKTRLADAEQRAAVAEALADERSKHIDDLRRMLPAPEQAQRRRHWPWSK